MEFDAISHNFSRIELTPFHEKATSSSLNLTVQLGRLADLLKDLPAKE